MLIVCSSRLIQGEPKAIEYGKNHEPDAVVAVMNAYPSWNTRPAGEFIFFILEVPLLGKKWNVGQGKQLNSKMIARWHDSMAKRSPQVEVWNKETIKEIKGRQNDWMAKRYIIEMVDRKSEILSRNSKTWIVELASLLKNYLWSLPTWSDATYFRLRFSFIQIFFFK